MSATTVPGGARQIRSLTITDADVAALNKDGAAGTPSMRTLGSGAQQACAGNDSRLTDSRNPTGSAGGDLSSTYPNPVVKQASTSFALPGDISPPQITADQNDYNPTGLSTAAVLLLNSDASRNITGLAGGADGRMLVVVNNGANDIVIKDQNASSVAANRFQLSALPTGGGGGGSSTTSGTLASRPAAGNTGNLYFCTDAQYIFRDNGTSWDAYGLIEALSPPNDSLFSWVNQAGSSTSSANGSVRMNCLSNGGSDNFHLRVKAIPAAPYTLTMGFHPLFRLNNFIVAGLCIRESSTGKFSTIAISALQSGAGYENLVIYDSASPTGSFTSRYTLQWAFSSPAWLRIADDGTNVSFSIGCDPYNFIPLFTEGRTAYLIGGADQYGYCMDSFNADSSIVVVHLKEN